MDVLLLLIVASPIAVSSGDDSTAAAPSAESDIVVLISERSHLGLLDAAQSAPLDNSNPSDSLRTHFTRRGHFYPMRFYPSRRLSLLDTDQAMSPHDARFLHTPSDVFNCVALLVGWRDAYAQGLCRIDALNRLSFDGRLRFGRADDALVWRFRPLPCPVGGTAFGTCHRIVDENDDSAQALNEAAPIDLLPLVATTTNRKRIRISCVGEKCSTNKCSENGAGKRAVEPPH